MVRVLISVAVGWSKNGVPHCRVSVSFNKMVPIKRERRQFLIQIWISNLENVSLFFARYFNLFKIAQQHTFLYLR